MKTLIEWLKTKRVCAWCHLWLGGNPLSWSHTHGICPACLENQKLELAARRKAQVAA